MTAKELKFDAKLPYCEVKSHQIIIMHSRSPAFITNVAPRFKNYDLHCTTSSSRDEQFSLQSNAFALSRPAFHKESRATT